jgi:hypothetical protein
MVVLQNYLSFVIFEVLLDNPYPQPILVCQVCNFIIAINDLLPIKRFGGGIHVKLLNIMPLFERLGFVFSIQ